MIGTPTDSSGRTNFLQGDAELTFDFSNSSLNASFTNIKNITRNSDHSVSQIRFSNINVNQERGTFDSGSIGNRIQGGFYGSEHAETAGVVEQSGIVGSFGAKKQ